LAWVILSWTISIGRLIVWPGVLEPCRRRSPSIGRTIRLCLPGAVVGRLGLGGGRFRIGFHAQRGGNSRRAFVDQIAEVIGDARGSQPGQDTDVEKAHQGDHPAKAGKTFDDRLALQSIRGRAVLEDRPRLNRRGKQVSPHFIATVLVALHQRLPLLAP